jgi:hypothetical protein
MGKVEMKYLHFGVESLVLTRCGKWEDVEGKNALKRIKEKQNVKVDWVKSVNNYI